MKVCVIGLGYVGLPTALLMVSGGHDVLGVDIDIENVKRLNEGKTKIDEADVVALMAEAHASGRFRAITPQVSNELNADAYMICVPTPVRNRKADMSYVDAAAGYVAKYVKAGDLVILESTSSIGTTDRLQKLVGEAVLCAYCPERVLPGNTVDEIVFNNRVIGGVPEAVHAALRLLETYCQGEISATTARTAEFVKLAENTYRDVNIAIANTFANIAEAADVDVWEMIRIANKHPRVNILNPGFVSGHCLPLDPWFLISAYPAESRLLHDARMLNDFQTKHVARAVRFNHPEKVAILGLTYKPDVGDTRESQSLVLCEELAGNGVEVRRWDPLLPETGKLEDAIRDTDIAVLMIAHSKFKTLRPEDLAGMRGKRIYDACNVINPEKFPGFKVEKLGV